MSLPEAFQEATADVGATAEPCAASAELSESPRLVTRGETTPPHESFTDAARDTAFVDWLGFTVIPPPGMGLDWVLHAVETTFRVPREKWTEKGRGWFGYTTRLDLGHFGLVAYGGETQKGTVHVELDGRGCRCIEDWNGVRLWGEVYKATLTRVDLAHDDFIGSVINIAQSLEWWHAGAFVCNGRAPRAEFIDDMGSGHGRTLYVGRRGSGKAVRFYEKGKQLGDPLSPWARVEVELRNKGRVIPWETVTHPGPYLAGAYPVLAFLDATQSRLRTTRESTQISYEAMERNLRVQGGKALNVMCRVHQGDSAAVMARLVREGTPKRLAGLESAFDSVDTGNGSDD